MHLLGRGIVCKITAQGGSQAPELQFLLVRKHPAGVMD